MTGRDLLAGATVEDLEEWAVRVRSLVTDSRIPFADRKAMHGLAALARAVAHVQRGFGAGYAAFRFTITSTPTTMTLPAALAALLPTEGDR